MRQDETSELIGQLELIVRDIRHDNPGMALRYIYHKLPQKLIGRDRFEKCFKQMGYGVSFERNFTRTTDSRGVTKFENLAGNIKLKAADNLWVSDITYYELSGRFFYLTFILDAFTRRIVGYAVSSSLKTTETTIPALRMAIELRGYTIKNKPIFLIFHSDGGGQYYCKEFLALLRSLDIKSSMAETVYENSKAERINGIIKNSYLKYWSIKTKADLVKSVDRAVKAYNSEKPHSGLGLQTPIDFEKKLLSLCSPKVPKMINSSMERSERMGIEPITF